MGKLTDSASSILKRVEDVISLQNAIFALETHNNLKSDIKYVYENISTFKFSNTRCTMSCSSKTDTLVDSTSGQPSNLLTKEQFDAKSELIAAELAMDKAYDEYVADETQEKYRLFNITVGDVRKLIGYNRFGGNHGYGECQNTLHLFNGVMQTVVSGIMMEEL